MQRNAKFPAITTTGHSLGGTLAQLTAYELGLRGETFDAYGAAGLIADIPEGGNQVINHVRSTDFVSAASQHHGEVRVYSPQQDIDALLDQGYANDGRRLSDLRNPLGVALGIGIEAHYSRNFLPGNNLLGESVISEANAARYAQHQPQVDKYRNDIGLIHGTLALPRNMTDQVIDTAREVVRGRQAQSLPGPAFDASHCALPAAARPSQPGHPDHMLLQAILHGVHAVDHDLGRTPDESSERIAAALLIRARQDGLQRVDHVVLGAPGASASGGANMFAVQGALDDPAHRRTRVDIATALETPADHSFRQLENSEARRLQMHQPMDAQQLPTAAQSWPTPAVQSAQQMSM